MTLGGTDRRELPGKENEEKRMFWTNLGDVFCNFLSLKKEQWANFHTAELTMHLLHVLRKKKFGNCLTFDSCPIKYLLNCKTHMNSSMYP